MSRRIEQQTQVKTGIDDGFGRRAGLGFQRGKHAIEVSQSSGSTHYGRAERSSDRNVGIQLAVDVGAILKVLPKLKPLESQ